MGRLADSMVPVDEAGTIFRWDFDRFYRSLSPAQQRNWDRRRKVMGIQHRIHRLCPWLNWPLLNLVTVFWVSLVEEGVVNTIKARWGPLTFSYLNDGHRPTLWHTYQQVMHPRGKYEGIYPSGAPKSRQQADEWERKWTAERTRRNPLPNR